MRYSSAIFNGGKRGKKQFLKFGNLLIFDVDNDGDNILSLSDAIEIFSTIMSLIVTTKSHDIEKNGVVANRFRIMIPLDGQISVSADEYPQFYMHCASKFGIDKYIDSSCKDVARMYQPNPNQQVHYSDSQFVLQEMVLRISFEEEKFLKESKRVTTYISSNMSTAVTDNGKLEYIKSILFSQEFLDLMHYAERFIAGNRNSYLYSVGCYLQDSGLTSAEIKSSLMWINNIRGGLKEAELESTIFRSLKL